MNQHLKNFRRLSLLSLIAVYILIVIGSSVRVSGSGMGCPDWPTCFGRVIPPVSESQLPANYRQTYAHLGYANKAFNPAKTWIEFGNRLSGVTTGLLILLTFGYCLIFLSRHRLLLVLSGAVLAITSFQGWLGSIVVSSNLHPLMISSHMVLALVIVAGLHSQIELTNKTHRLPKQGKTAERLLLLSCLLLVIQIALGLGVREQIDQANVVFGREQRYLWISSIDSTLVVHGLFAFCIALACVTFLFLTKNVPSIKLFTVPARLWALAVSGSLLTGLVIYVLDIPAAAQPLHLLFASLQFGVLYHMLLRMLRSQSPGARTRI